MKELVDGDGYGESSLNSKYFDKFILIIGKKVKTKRRRKNHNQKKVPNYSSNKISLLRE